MEETSGSQDEGLNRWLERLAEGEPSALEGVYDEVGPQLYRYALGMLGRTEAAEDAVQDLFVSLACARGRLGKVRSARAYLFAMLRHAVWKRLRREAEGHSSAASATIFERPQPPGLPEGAASDVESALAQLPAEQREAIVLKLYQDMTFAEIAAMTGVSLNTAASRYRYALDKLRALLPEDLLQ